MLSEKAGGGIETKIPVPQRHKCLKLQSIFAERRVV